ncbi:MAG TPA: hypothetical protein VMR50_18445 [Myxococcota bacterium]|nr:hypothetical protein [Myxococcota bacterium]
MPAIKGSVLRPIVEHAREVCRKRSIPVADLERRLGAGGAQLFGAEIRATDWYPVSLYGPLRQFLREVEGGGRDRYTIDSAIEGARRLIASGIYPQLEFLKQAKPLIDRNSEPKARRELFVSQLERVSTIHNALFNFSRVDVRDDPEHEDRVQLEFRDSGVMPYDGRLAVLGYWLEMSAHLSPSRRGNLWTKIDAPDHYILRMNRDISDL